jgi:hypothetical protein
MSLIIGVRCKGGCLLIADRRNHIWTNGVATYRDDFRKVLAFNGYLVYNHGYNRIGNADWKLRHGELTPDKDNPVYGEILAEMASKPDKAAFYVFLNRTELHEIGIRVGAGVSYIDHLPHDRIVSGTGEKYVDLQLLVNLQKANCSTVRPKLRRTFQAAHNRMKSLSGTEFSEQYGIEELLS